MGMFDKDKEIGRQLEDEFAQNEEFVLLGVSMERGAVKTDIGPADKTTLTVVRLKDGREVGDKFEVNTLASAIANKADEATEDDFPAVVKWMKAHSKAYNSEATVLQFIRDYDDPVKF